MMNLERVLDGQEIDRTVRCTVCQASTPDPWTTWWMNGGLHHEDDSWDCPACVLEERGPQEVKANEST